MAVLSPEGNFKNSCALIPSQVCFPGRPKTLASVSSLLFLSFFPLNTHIFHWGIRRLGI